MKRKSFGMLLLHFFGFLLISFLLCYIVLGAIALAVNTFLTILLSVCSIGIFLALMGHVAYQEGRRDLKLVKLKRVEQPAPYRCLVCGLLVVVPLYATVVLLAASKAGLIGNFYTLYKVLNPWFLPLTTLLSPQVALSSGELAPSANVADIGWWVIAVYAVLPLLVPLASHLSYKYAYSDKQITERIIFSKKGPYQREDD